MKITLNEFNPSRPLGFIVLEGVNGAGKSTLQSKISEWATAKNVSVTCSQEPGGTDLGKQLRTMLLETSSSERTPLAEALLFSADRAEHVEKVVRPALEQRSLVILDRYFYSTVAFQGYGHGLSIKPLLKMSDIATSSLKPDLVLLLDLDPETGLQRNQGKGETDSFEEEDMQFHKKIRNGFLKLAHSLPEPFVILDANQPADDILQQALPFVERIVAAG